MMLRELRLAFRTLAGSPGFLALATLTMAPGSGGGAAGAGIRTKAWRAVGKELAILPGGNPSIPVTAVQVVGLAANTKEAGLDDAVMSRLRQDLRRLDPEGALYGSGTMEQRIDEAPGCERFNLLRVSVFAGLAILLAGVGVYGAIAFSAAQRTREFGPRMALAAMPRAILGLTLQRTARLTLAGAVCGMCSR